MERGVNAAGVLLVALAWALPLTVEHAASHPCRVLCGILNTLAILLRCARQEHSGFYLDVFEGRRVDVEADQADAGDRHPGACGTQKAQLPDREKADVVIELLLDLV